MVLFLIWLFLNQITRAFRLDPKKVTYAINCGSSQSLQSKDGFTYLPDHNVVGETKISNWKEIFAEDKLIRYTDDQELYLTERWGPQKSFGYVIPLESEGNYVLITQHAENSWSAQNERVWDIQLGQSKVFQKLDVIKIAGQKHTAVNIYIPFKFENERIYTDQGES